MDSSSEQVTTSAHFLQVPYLPFTTLTPKTDKYLFRFLCLYLSGPRTTLPLVNKTLVPAIPAFTLSRSLDFSSHNFLTEKGIRSAELSKRPRSTTQGFTVSLSPYVMSHPLRQQGLWNARLPCLPLSPGGGSNSSPLTLTVWITINCGRF